MLRLCGKLPGKRLVQETIHLHQPYRSGRLQLTVPETTGCKWCDTLLVVQVRNDDEEEEDDKSGMPGITQCGLAWLQAVATSTMNSDAMALNLRVC